MLSAAYIQDKLRVVILAAKHISRLAWCLTGAIVSAGSGDLYRGLACTVVVPWDTNECELIIPCVDKVRRKPH